MSEQRKKTQIKSLLALLVLLGASAVMMLIYHFLVPQGTAGAKAITVEVVHGDGSSQSFPIRTDEAYLGPVLAAEGIAEGEDGPFGFYILTADGETADEGKQQWWYVTQDGVMLNTAPDSTPIADGDHFELTFTTGYDMALTQTDAYDHAS